MQKPSFMMPAKGHLISLEHVPDDMFSKYLLGDGFAIELSTGEIVAPFDGRVTAVFPGGHALGIRGKQGVDILIHIGLNAIRLQNDPFEVYVNIGDEVAQGQLLVKANLQKFKEGNVLPIMPVIFTNQAMFKLDCVDVDVEMGQSDCVHILE
jgi:glucose-specific phosphotransferase system IIA component